MCQSVLIKASRQNVTFTHIHLPAYCLTDNQTNHNYPKQSTIQTLMPSRHAWKKKTGGKRKG